MGFLYLLTLLFSWFKNANICLNTNIYTHLETSGGQSSNLYLNVVHFLNTSVNYTSMTAHGSFFMHWCPICAVLLCWMLLCWGSSGPNGYVFFYLYVCWNILVNKMFLNFSACLKLIDWKITTELDVNRVLKGNDSVTRESDFEIG